MSHLKRLLAWLEGCMPITRRKHRQVLGAFQVAYDHNTDTLTRMHSEAIEKVQRSVEEIQQRAMQIEFHHDPTMRRRYLLTISIDARLVEEGLTQELGLALLADMTARRVKETILTSRFVAEANRRALEEEGW